VIPISLIETIMETGIFAGMILGGTLLGYSKK
jgi:hypothetical protein